MDPLTRAISRVRRRLTAQRGLAALAWSLAGASAIVIVGLLGVRLSVVPAEWGRAWTPGSMVSAPSNVTLPGLALGVAMGVALVVAGVWMLLCRASASSAASVIDRRLGLKDCFASALHCRQTAAGPLGAVVIEQALAAARTVRPSEVAPVRLGRPWIATVVGMAVLAGLIAWLPEGLDPFGLAASRARQAAQQEEADDAREQLTQLAVMVEQWHEPEAGPADAEFEAAQLELAELTQRDLSRVAARTEAAAAVSDIQQRLAAAVERREQRLQDLGDALRQLENDQPGPADRFAQALQRGDFAAAAKAIDELMSAASQLPADEREAMAGQLGNLARQLQDMAANDAAREQTMRNALANAGLNDEQIEQLAQEGFDPEALERALDQLAHGELTDAQREQLMEQAQRMAKSSEGTREDLQRLAQGLSRMAEAQGGDGEQARDIMQQMARMRQQLQQMRKADQPLDDAMNRLAGCQGQCSEGSACPACAGEQNRGGGLRAGTAEGGDPMGEHRQMPGVGSVAREDLQDGRGRIVASWLTPGGAERNEAQVEFDQIITDAQSDAERAMTEDRVPRRFHTSVREYFDQLPAAAETAEGGQTPGSAPPAPQ